MAREGSVTFGDLDVERLEISCSKCQRRGSYVMAALMAVHGLDYRMTNFLAEISQDCPKRKEAGQLDRCAAFYPQLATTTGPWTSAEFSPGSGKL